MEERTTVAKANSNYASLRTTIPMAIVKNWKLKEGDQFQWEWHENEDTVIIRKPRKGAK